MSAEVEIIYLYQVWCADCATGTAPDENEDIAEMWAANHNAEHHEADNSNDDDYEKFKESRK